MNDETMMIDDEGAVRLLAPLREEPDPRTAIDVSRAMAEGLRRRRLRRWSSGVAALAVTTVTIGGGTLAVSALRDDPPEPAPSPTVTSTVASAPTAAAPAGVTACTVTRLPTGQVKKAVATAGDPSGRWAAGRLYSTQGHPAKTVIWKDGAIHQQLAMPGADADVVDLTSTGTGIANGYDADDHEMAFLYDNGRFTRLPGTDVSARAINESGVIVGALGTAEQDPLPIRWTSASAAPARLPLPAGATLGSAADLAEDGTVVGVAGPGTNATTGYLWFPDGTGRYLPLPTMRDGKRATSFAPDAIRDGWVSGDAVLETKESTSFTPMRYRIATGEYEMLPSGIGGASAISSEGWVAGEGRYAGALAIGSKLVELPAYGAKSTAPGAVTYDIRAISADGRVVIGYKAGDNLGNDPLRWTCN
jgi:hypothetical protein